MRTRKTHYDRRTILDAARKASARGRARAAIRRYREVLAVEPDNADLHAKLAPLLVRVGDSIRADQDIIEVETNKATMNVTAPCPGRLESLQVKLNESYPVGAVLGYVEATEEEAARLGLDQPETAAEVAGKSAGASSGDADTNGFAKRRVEPTVRGLPVPAHAAGAS